MDAKPPKAHRVVDIAPPHLPFAPGKRLFMCQDKLATNLVNVLQEPDWCTDSRQDKGRDRVEDGTYQLSLSRLLHQTPLPACHARHNSIQDELHGFLVVLPSFIDERYVL